jgi:hypothetical protein
MKLYVIKIELEESNPLISVPLWLIGNVRGGR